ncbi:MAG: hypothetical protein J0I79_11845 [Mesorhizobium sp.]|nr:hypothetical protein [Mesorhizobium sp.]MBN9218637.1 hypothetical protein [Mesorhizobium sp.]
MTRPGLRCVQLCAALLAADCPRAVADGARLYEAGAYSFSDELGGFRILSATGVGTRADPIVVTEELETADPVTLTIRAAKPIQPFGSTGDYATGYMPLKIVVLNNSGDAWIEFEFELQSIMGTPSDYGDGLSFDQAQREDGMIKSDSFAEFKRDFEPYDRLLFRKGKVDPLETASFSFLVTDFSPKERFFLVEEPHIPSS